jgi:hypothetical protein
MAEIGSFSVLRWCWVHLNNSILWLRLASSNGLHRTGIFHPFIWGCKHLVSETSCFFKTSDDGQIPSVSNLERWEYFSSNIETYKVLLPSRSESFNDTCKCEPMPIKTTWKILMWWKIGIETVHIALPETGSLDWCVPWFSLLPSVDHQGSRLLPQVRPWPLTSLLFPIRYSQAILLFM